MTLLPPPPAEAGPPARRRPLAPILLSLLACGCGLLLLVGLASALGLWYVGRQVNLTLDPAEAQQRAEALLPGVRPLPGQTPVMAGTLAGCDGVLYNPEDPAPGASPPPMGVIVALPDTGKADPKKVSEELLRHLRGEDSSSQRVVDSGLVAVTVRGRPEQAVFTVMERSNGDVVRAYYLVLPGGGGRHVMVMLFGPEGTFDEAALQRFLDPVS